MESEARAGTGAAGVAALACRSPAPLQCRPLRVGRVQGQGHDLRVCFHTGAEDQARVVHRRGLMCLGWWVRWRVCVRVRVFVYLCVCVCVQRVRAIRRDWSTQEWEAGRRPRPEAGGLARCPCAGSSGRSCQRSGAGGRHVWTPYCAPARRIRSLPSVPMVKRECHRGCWRPSNASSKIPILNFPSSARASARLRPKCSCSMSRWTGRGASVPSVTRRLRRRRTTRRP